MDRPLASAPLTIRSLRARAVAAPMRRRLTTASGGVDKAPLVLIDLETDQGITGVSYVFLPSMAALQPMVALLHNMMALIQGMDVAPAALEQHLRRRFMLLSGTGLVTLAIGGIDMAAWDALGKAAGWPLARLLGGTPRPILAYNSTGLGLAGPERTAAEAVELLEFGFTAIKLRLGYPTLEEDVAVTRAVMRAVPRGTIVMCDYNQALSVPEAIRRGHALDGEGLYWIEEPTRADDYAGNARISRELGTAVQIGENFWSASDMAKAIAAGACDYVMPDASKIGGITAWMRCAALAEAHGVPMSTHLFPEVSAHLMTATPTAHYLEWVDWANPVLEEPYTVDKGHIVVPDRPGAGITWNEAAIARLLVA
jgi:mandelate racemase